MTPRFAMFLAVFAACGLARGAETDVKDPNAKPKPAPVSADHARKMAAGLDLFKNHVRTLLTDHCVKCHGGKMTKGEFDLNTREGLLAAGPEGPSVIAGDSKASKFVKLINHTAQPRMPHKEPKLPDQAIAQIAEWIDAGAPYDKPLIDKGVAPKGRAVVTDQDRKFWSFLPLAKVEPPAVKDEAWCRTPVDRFIAAKLEAKGIAANGDADKRRLIRRAYFGLTGLPPTPAEVEAFVKDPAPDAYEKLVDKLLADAGYGERWGRHWLDLARFAESHGYEQDYDRPYAYHYRDFVIRALNEDMPYDRFVKLQIAGDEIEPDNPAAWMATGFLGAGTHATQITANQAEKERYDELDDMASTVGTALLGVTVGCARCHDHKFDPIPTRDYYRLISTFTTTVRSDYDIDTDPARYKREKALWDQEHRRLFLVRQKFEDEEIAKRFEAWLAKGEKPKREKWLSVVPGCTFSGKGTSFTRLDDASILMGGTNPDHDAYSFVLWTTLPQVTGVRIEALADKSLPKNGPGRAANGNFALTKVSISAAPSPHDKYAPVTIASAKATFEQKGFAIANVINGDGKAAWAIDGQTGKDHAAVFRFAEPVKLGDVKVFNLGLAFENNKGHGIGRLRISLTDEAEPALAGKASPELAFDAGRLINLPPEERKKGDWGRVWEEVEEKWFQTIDPEWIKLNQAVVEHAKKEPKPYLVKAMVCSEGVKAIRLHTQGPDFYEKTFYLKRGDLAQKNGEAQAGFPQVLMPKADDESRWQRPPPPGSKTSYRRRALAEWITDADQGAGRLLARVIVNRLWQHHLGRGIVSTPSDFGAQGERPTHPELLDWLAGELIRGGWRLKPIHRLIMTSAVYRQSCAFDAARNAADPNNALFWRREPRRLEGEVIRDSMLAVGAALDRTMYGPGSLDENFRRRSIYFTVKRSKLIPWLALFDGPDSLQSLGLRASTTIAPQAMAILNNAQVRAAAKGLAKRIDPDGKAAPEDAVKAAYALALSRAPDADELADSAAFVKAQADSYKTAGRADARDLALADFCQALMSLNEFVYVD